MIKRQVEGANASRKRPSQGRMCMGVRTLKMLMGPKVESRLAVVVREAAPRSKGLAWRWPCRRKKGDSVPGAGEEGRSCFAPSMSPCMGFWSLLSRAVLVEWGTQEGWASHTT